MHSKTQTRFHIENAQSGSPEIWLADHREDLDVSEVCEVLADVSDDINDVLNTRGALLIKGLAGLRTPADFGRAMEVVTPSLRDYIGGTSPRATVHGKVMEATRVPASWSIVLHQEMAYTRDMPPRISFFCEVPAARGGDSTVGDMRVALELIDPGVRDRLDGGRLQLRRALPSEGRVHLKPGVQKSWSEVFGTNDKNEAAAAVEAKGWRAEWSDNDTLVLWQDVLPAVRVHGVNGDRVWCNQAHFFSPICMMEWALEDGREDDYRAIAEAREANPELLDYTCYASGEPVDDESSLHVYRVLRSLERPLALERGDLLLLDNMLFAHGRTAFDGQREIRVVLADAPDRPNA